MIKRKISLVIVLMMVLSLMIPNFTLGATNDYSNHWAEKNIQEWVDNGQLTGYEDGSVKPDLTITRAEFMTMVNSAFKFTAKDNISFKDVKSSDWYYEEVQKAAAEGYIIGYEDNTARPGNKITRQEAALIISRIKELSESSVSAKTFTDYNTIATWSVGGVGAVAKAKIMIGYEDDSFKPDRFITRSEALVTIDRSIEEVHDNETPDTNGSNSGNNDSGSSGGNNYAVLSGLLYNDGTTSSAISVTSYSAIVTTTSSAVTISAITTTGTAVTFATTTTTTGVAITTSSAVAGTVDTSIVFEAGVNTAVIKLTVYGDDYMTREYIITINKI